MLTLDSTVKLANDVIFQDLDGEAVLLNMQTEIYFGLDAMGTRIWHLLQKHGVVRPVARLLLDEYDIGEDQLQNYLLEFIEKLQSKGLVEIQGS